MTLFLSLILACGSPAVEEAPVAEPSGTEAAPAEAAPAEKTADADEHFGATFTLTESATVASVLSDPAGHKGKKVRVAGEITQVCQKAGCWMVLRDESGETMRITTKDHGYGVNKQAAGRIAHVEGEVLVKAVDPERVAHFKSESESKEAPEDGKTETVEIDAASVLIEAAKS